MGADAKLFGFVWTSVWRRRSCTALRLRPCILAERSKRFVSVPRAGRFVADYYGVGDQASDIREMNGKQLQMRQEIRPAVTRAAVLGDPRINNLQFRATESVAGRLGITLHALPLTEPKEIPGLVAEAALTHRLPTVSGFVPSFAEAGGLLAYGPDFPDLFRRAAGHVLEILKGARPGDLPVQRPTKFPLLINLKTAKALGVTIPPSLLLRADQVIE